MFTGRLLRCFGYAHNPVRNLAMFGSGGMVVGARIVRRLQSAALRLYLSCERLVSPRPRFNDQSEAFDLDGTLDSLKEAYPSIRKAPVPIDIMRGIKKEASKKEKI